MTNTQPAESFQIPIKAAEAYAARERRFGLTSDQVRATKAR